jgi:tryptophan-rich sensory protein
MTLVNSYVMAALICAVFAGLETAMAGAGASRFLRELRQPRWALPLPVWYALGLLYYVTCYLILVSLLRRPSFLRSWELWLLGGIMAWNAAWNFFFFRKRDLRKSFSMTVFYSAAVFVLLFRLLASNTAGTWLLLAYALYLPYSWLWTYRVGKMNEPAQGAVSRI